MKKLFVLSTSLLFYFAGHSQLLPVPLDVIDATRNRAPRLFTPFNNDLYFIAEDMTHGTELWKYTGTGLPQMVHDLNPNLQTGALSQDFERMAVIGSTLYFAGDNGSTGFELYKYTGSGAPVLAKEINAGVTNSNVKSLVALAGKLYFSAWTAANGTELYQYDPSSNTTNFYDTYVGTSSGEPKSLTVMNGKLYFNGTADVGGTELLMIDPATNNVTVAANVAAANTGSDPQNLKAIGNSIYFTAATDTAGREFWRYDGVNAIRISDLNPGTGSALSYTTSNVTKFALYNGEIYFAGTDGTGAHKLCRYNESTGNLTTVHTISATPALSEAFGFIVYDGKLYFAADDGINGSEIWVHDGTTTSMLTNLNVGNNSANFSDPVVWNGSLYFNANNGTGPTMYKLGTPTGIRSVNLDGDVRVFPNPATGICYFSLDLKTGASCVLSLYDATGKLIFNTGLKQYPAGTTSVQLPVASLAAGEYFYHLSDSHGQVTATGRLTKQ